MADEFNTTSSWWDSSSRYGGSSVSSSSSSTTSSSVVLQDSSSDHHHLHMMGLNLDWNQSSLLRGGDKSDGSFRSMLQQDSDATLNSSSGYRGFSLDQFSPLDSSSATNLYGNNNNSTIYQGGGGMLVSENQNYHYAAAAVSGGYGMSVDTNELLPSWSAAAANNSNSNSNKVGQFLTNSTNQSSSPPSKPQQHLQFSNNTPFWNASTGGGIDDVRSPNFFPTLQTPYAAAAATTHNFDEIKPAKISDHHHHHHHHHHARNTGSKKSSGGGSEQLPAAKRTKNDQTTSSLPAFKVRKEKMGDRITALQQLVSPFGKTDTASVLSEAIEYVKFFHEQVAVLSTRYMKSGAPIPHQQNMEKKSKESDGAKQDLRSKGLCLVPVSSTFPVIQETTVDFWTPTFGGTFR